MKKIKIADIEVGFEKDLNDRLCNICLKPNPLSEDHVPPQGVVGNNAVIIDSIVSRLSGGGPFQHKLISQNGVKFKSICQPCNGRMKKGDKKLKHLAEDVKTIIESRIYRPRPVVVCTTPNLIMRSVLGHMMAAKTQTGYTPFEVAVRPCLEDYSVPIPESVHVFYWVYPFRTIRIWRDFAMPTSLARPGSLATFQLLKFYPLAFLATDAPEFKGLYSFDDYRSEPLGKIFQIPLHLDGVPPEDWPEAPGDDGVTILSATAIKSLIAQRRDTMTDK